MPLFSLLPFLVSIGLIFLGIFVYSRNNKQSLNKIFFFLCLVSSVWLFFYSLAYFAEQRDIAFLWLRTGYSGVVFIATIIFHYVVLFLRMNKMKWIIFLNYILGLFWIFTIWGSYLFIKEVKYFFWGYYPIAGKIHPLFLVHFMSLMTASISLLLYYWYFKKAQLFSLEKNQIKYMFVAFSIYNFASIDFMPNYGLSLYPFGYIPTFLFILITGYTIIRYQLMDIKVALSRVGIFVLIYSLVLGIPFALAFGWEKKLIDWLGSSWWIVPLVFSTVLATTGPFIYLYINKKAEDALLREQKSYQNVLLGASSGMVRIKEIKRLLNLIVHMVTKSVKIKHAAIYLLDTENNSFGLQAARGWDGRKETFIRSDSSLIRHLAEKKEPVVAEEEVMRSREEQYNPQLSQLVEQLSRLDAALAVPSFIDNKLTGLLILGEKISKKIYSQDDLNVFSVLANQAALAIENAQFYEEIKRTHQQLFQAEKLATIGTMADGLSHQINNRFHALSLIAGDALDVLKTLDDPDCGDRTKEALCDIRGALERIETNVMQGGEVVKGLLKYSRPDEAGSEPVDLISVLNGAIEMVQYKIKLKEIDLIQDIPPDLPAFSGSLTQLQEVFFNLIDNAYDATKERQATLKEPGYKGRIEISAAAEGGFLKINVSDNGIGVKDLDKKKLFTPFFTTKATAKKGTGLGLYVIEKIIAMHNGRVAMESAYQSGTTFTISLPVAH